MAAVATACSGDDDDLATVTSSGSSTSTSGGSTTSTTRAATTTVTASPEQRAPLTGLPYGFLQNPARPALAVKIDGAPEAQPQVGLDVADVVYEEPVEGLIRYIAIFHSKDPGDVGPIRSARPMDADLIEPLHGLFAISGGIGAFVNAARDVSRVFQEGNEAYYRATDRRAPHNLLGNAVGLWNQADGETTPAPLWDFDTTAPTTSLVCTIDLAYFSSSRIHYDLDPPTGTWKRSINGEPQMAADGQQIAPNNIVVQLVDTEATQFVDVTGTKVVKTIVVGSGDAYVMTGGTGHIAHWDRPDASQTGQVHRQRDRPADQVPARYDLGGAGAQGRGAAAEPPGVSTRHVGADHDHHDDDHLDVHDEVLDERRQHDPVRLGDHRWGRHDHHEAAVTGAANAAGAPGTRR